MFKKPDWSFKSARDREPLPLAIRKTNYENHTTYENDIQRRIKRLLGKSTSGSKVTTPTKAQKALELL